MNSNEVKLVKSALEQKKFSVITEYAHIIHSDKNEIVVNEYAGKDVRVYKDTDNRVSVLYPKNATAVQEGHVANAIANGTIFDDADAVDKNAMVIERNTLPYNAMINAGKDVPHHVKPMIAVIIGKMDVDGVFDINNADRTNGENFLRDAVATKDADNKNNINDVVNNYLDYDKDAPYTRDLGGMVHGLDKELDDIHDTEYEDTVSDEDIVDSYDDFDIDAIEKGESDDTGNNDKDNDDADTDDDGDKTGEDKSEDSDDDENDDDTDVEDAEVEDVDDDDDEFVEESLKVSRDDMRGEFMQRDVTGTTYHSGKPKEKKKAIKLTSNKIVVKSEDLKEAMTGDFIRCVKDGEIKMIKVTVGKALIDKHDKVKITIDGDSAKITVMSTEQSTGVEPEKKSKTKIVKTPFGSFKTTVQEGFLTKKPKKLKPIGRDVVAYITCEMNDIHSANDQAMLAGYTCSKIELVDFYITALDTQDARYIVPHNRAYLVTIKAELERLLAEILRIKPINRSDQIWRVNYPTA